MTRLLLDDENDANLKQIKDNLPWCFHQQTGFVVIISLSHHSLNSKLQALLKFEDSFHQLPFGGGGSSGVAALELCHIGFPLGLAGQSGQARVVGLPVKVVDRVTDHEQAVAMDINLHVQDAHTADALLNLGPHMGMGLYIVLYHLAVVPQFKGLAISFHRSSISKQLKLR